MDPFVCRLMSLTEGERETLHNDPVMMGQLQWVHFMMESKLQQITNASSYDDNTTTNYNDHLTTNINHYTDLAPVPQSAEDPLDLRVPQQHPTKSATKKPKGEFDEPNLKEIEDRMRSIVHKDSYHLVNSLAGDCACVLGTEFRDETASGILAKVELWRQLPIKQRLAYQWSERDLPRDIPLIDITRLESLRGQASQGRANFGGVSKRKPMGIRGTRQFLLILYCVWGHPGREDPMQRDGYCPHCFAKIVRPNDRSILVRVVNHFNMKHKRGANPRQQAASPTTSSSLPSATPTPTRTPTPRAPAVEEDKTSSGKQQQQQ